MKAIIFDRAQERIIENWKVQNGICMDLETGEIIEDWEIRPDEQTQERMETSETQSFMRLRTWKKKGNSLRPQDIMICEDEPEEEDEELLELDEPEFGEMRPLMERARHRFTKHYQTCEPQFSKAVYGAYWLRVTHAVEKNTGIVCHRNRSGHVKRVSSVKDWQTLLTYNGKPLSRSAFNTFRKEAISKGYLLELDWTVAGKKVSYWFVNPFYCWNGNMIPKMLWDIVLGHPEMAKEIQEYQKQMEMKARNERNI